MSYLGKRLKYFAEIEGQALTIHNLVYNEKSQANAGSFSFEVWDPSSEVIAKLRPTKLFELWIGFVDHSSWDTTEKGDLQKLSGILKMPEKRLIAGRVTYLVEGVDRSAEAHNYTINAAFTNQRPDQIVIAAWQAAAAKVGGPSGVTFNNVAQADFTIPEYRSDYKTLFTIMEEMRDATGWVWRRDAFGDVHFQPPAMDYYGVLTNTDAIVGGSAQFRDDASQLANAVWVFGGITEIALDEPIRFVGNAEQYTYPLPHQPILETVTVLRGGVGQIVGRDGVDTFATHNVLVNPITQAAIFDPANPPGNGVLVSINYSHGAPVITRREDGDSVLEFGLHEHVIVDAEIQDVGMAAERARAHLREFARPTRLGEFEAYVWDVRAGQSVHVIHAPMGIDRVYTVYEVDREVRGPENARVTIKVRASPPQQSMAAKIQEIDQRLTRLESRNIPSAAPVNTYTSIVDTFNITDDPPTLTYAPPESRVGHARVGYSQAG